MSYYMECWRKIAMIDLFYDTDFAKEIFEFSVYIKNIKLSIYSQILDIKKRLRELTNKRITTDQRNKWLIDWLLSDYLIKLEDLQRQRRWELAQKQGHTSPQADLKEIKLIPITKILPITPLKPIKCLWHNEKTPSLRLHPKKNMVHCFGCGFSGSVIDVYMKINNCKVGQAIKDLSKLL